MLYHSGGQLSRFWCITDRLARLLLPFLHQATIIAYMMPPDQKSIGAFRKLLGRFGRWLASFAQGGRKKGVGERVIGGALMGATGFGWPGAWTADRIEHVLHYRHWTYVAIRAIASTIAGCKPNIAWVSLCDGSGKRSDADHRFTGANHFHHRSLGAISQNDRVSPTPPDHPLNSLLARPNAWDVSFDFWYELTIFLELTGNAYIWTVPTKYQRRTGNFLPCELWVLPSHWVWPRLGKSGIEYYEVRPFTGPGVLHFPPDEVIHLRWKSPIHKIDGYSPQTAGAEWIDCAESINRARFWQFKNGCFPMGSLELGENYHDPDDKELERIYAKFFSRLQGEQNYGRPIITPPGAKYNPLTISPSEMGYTESADQLRDYVLALWGVPKEIAGVQDAGSEIAIYGPLAQFTGFTIVPKLRYLGQVLTDKLCRRIDPKIRLWFDDPVPQSMQMRNSSMDLDGKYGWITPNEARAERGRRPYTPEEEAQYCSGSSDKKRGNPEDLLGEPMRGAQ